MRAQARADDRRLHELRKQVKHLAAALPLLPLPDTRRAALAESLGDTLGADRDLALLQEKARLGKALRKKAERRRAKLQKKALKQARQLYK